MTWNVSEPMKRRVSVGFHGELLLFTSMHANTVVFSYVHTKHRLPYNSHSLCQWESRSQRCGRQGSFQPDAVVVSSWWASIDGFETRMCRRRLWCLYRNVSGWTRFLGIASLNVSCFIDFLLLFLQDFEKRQNVGKSQTYFRQCLSHAGPGSRWLSYYHCRRRWNCQKW